MRRTSKRAAIAIFVVVASLAPAVFGAGTAVADTAPDLACGNTQPGPCTETAHFTETNELNSPAPPGGGCPAWVSTDFATFAGSGNGVEHITVNKAQDVWFTTTFTGTMTVTAYLHGSIDSDGNVTSVSDPDPSVLPFTGKTTQWFGVSFNKQNAVEHSTFHFSGTNAAGESFRVLDVSHASSTPRDDPNGPPHITFDKFRCS